jgi:hypothetical protein
MAELLMPAKVMSYNQEKRLKLNRNLMERKLLLLMSTSSCTGRFFMGQVIYNDHTILHTSRPSSRREDSAGFIAVAAISWQTRDGVGDVHLLRLSELYPTEEEASTAALEEGKRWVDSHQVDFERSPPVKVDWQSSRDQ